MWTLGHAGLPDPGAPLDSPLMPFPPPQSVCSDHQPGWTSAPPSHLAHAPGYKHPRAVLVVQCASPAPASTAGSLKALTWGQVQLVESFELLCEVSVVHATCGARPGRRTCLARRLQGHIAGCVPTPFLWVLVVTPQSGTAWHLLSQVSREAQTSPGPPASLEPYGKA